MKRSRPATSASSERGYVLLTLVLLGALVAAATLSFARHAILAADGAATSVAHERGENAIGSGMAFATQSLLADGAGSLSQTVDGEQIDVAVTALSDTQRQFTITSADADGAAYSLDVLAEVYPVADGQLPSLTPEANSIARTAPGLMNISSDTYLEDTEIAGVVMVRRGIKLTLENVVLRGLIITENATRGSTGDPDDDAEIVIKGGLLVESGTLLQGLAIMAPDVVIDGSDTNAALQVHGAVVARGLSMAGPAAIHGQLVTEQPPVFLGRAEFPGAGRAPRAWPDSLAFDGRAVGRVAFRFDDPTSAEKAAIQAFSWPAQGTMGTFSSAQAAQVQSMGGGDDDGD